MYALVDATSFYASAEKVFDLEIRNKPVAVLSNNDGCIVAISPEAKRLGVKKFEPYFKYQGMLEKHGVVIHSSNYELYADLSEKMMNIIGKFSDKQYVYSIDEAFLKFDGFASIVDDWNQYGHLIRRTVWKKTKLAVGVGFGPTPTLAKAANHAAKKFSDATGVAVIDDEQSRIEILKRMDIDNVWGVGKRLSKKLSIMGIKTALDLANQSPKHMRKQFSVVLERTIEELNGNKCLEWDEIKQRKKEIFSTRSFGERVTCPVALKAALISHCTIVTRKLRQQESIANKIIIFARSSPFEDGYCKKSFIHSLPVASCDSMVFAKAVDAVFDDIFQPGIKYAKAGVGAIDLVDDNFRQADLFNVSEDNSALMNTLDAIKSRFGTGAARIASEIQSNEWKMKRSYLSPCYTTRWSDIPKIKC